MSNVRKLEPVMKSCDPVEIDEKKDLKETTESFDEIVRKNRENQERLKKERAKANKGVIKSYRLTK